jgi:mono/diheme cytochrome c family protein
MTRIVAAAAILAIHSNSVLAGDPEDGKQVAERWCSSCHLVAAGQAAANADVPTFMSLGKRRNITGDRLAFLLLNPHPAMPQLSLSREEISDLAAYINVFSRTD